MILGDSMKNKNGFTLVELIAIIILLGAIITVTYTSVTGVLKRQKLKLFEESLNGIIDSATIYATENKYSFTAIEGKIWYSRSYNQRCQCCRNRRDDIWCCTRSERLYYDNIGYRCG